MLAWHLPNNLNFLHPKRSALMPLFVSGMIRRASVTLLSIFSPIYIFLTMSKFGASRKTSVIFVIVYYLLFLVIKFVGLSIAENFSGTKGLKRTIWWSAIPFALFIPAIIFASKVPILFVAASILWGMHVGFYWWGYHGYFIKTGKMDHYGMSIAEAGLLETVISVLVPLLGVVIIAVVGFEFLFIFALFLMILSLLYLGKDYEVRQRTDIKIGNVFRLILKHRAISLGYVGSGFDGIIYTNIWPLFLFLLFGQIVDLGVIVSLSTLMAAFYALAIGGWVDKKGEKQVVSLGSPMVFLAWVLKYLQRTPGVFVVADSLWNFGQRMVALPLNTLTYKKARESSIAQAILFREVNMIVGAFIGLTTVGFLVYFGQDLSVAFLVAAVASLMPLIIVFRRRMVDDKVQE